jgi:hypothetical protein
MSKSDHHEPRPERVPAQRARGLDPEITAQPRPIPDELALEASAEPELSVDPEDFGARFLSEAIEQGDFDPERAWEGSASLFESPARDQPLGSPNFNPIWEQTIDLQSRTQGAYDQLREPPPPLPGDEFDAEIDDNLNADATQVRSKESLRLGQSSIREFSLLDREGDEGDETIPPDVDLEEQRSHTRSAPLRELGQHMRSSETEHPREPATQPVEVRAPRGRNAGVQPEVRASATGATARAPQQSGRIPGIRTSALRVLRAALTHAAWILRRLSR